MSKNTHRQPNSSFTDASHAKLRSDSHFQVFKTILVVLLSTSNTVKAQFSRSSSEEFDSDGFWSENFRGMDDMNFDNFEFMPEFDFDSFFRKIDAPPLKEAEERSKNLHTQCLKIIQKVSLYNILYCFFRR